MNPKTSNFKLGLFTIGGLFILIAGILAFGARSYLQPTSLFETYVEGDVNGLAVGSPVELRGVRVGKITRINFSWNEYQETQPSYVVVEFEMRDDVTPWPPGAVRSQMLESAVKRGLRARLKGQGITGVSLLSLEYLNPAENPPAQVPWVPRHTYIPAAPGQFGELLASIERSLHNVEHLDFGAINQLLQGDLKSVGNVLNKVDQVDFGGIGTNANALLTELRSSNAKLKILIGDTDDTVKKMHLEKLAANLDGLIDQLRETVAKLEPGLANIDFDSLNQALANARCALRDMDDVLNELKEYPSGFLFGQPPPELKEVQPKEKK
ncbi:MAG TPA: MlaD family protein [Candidatus Cybelea sp.]|jgi:ABC-type transporter Mla subunit MlaD|nr:MlaD family protein [Candidatus Cybelea sp.]